MDFSLSEEQRLVKDSVERFVRETYPFDKRRELAAGEPGFSHDTWQRFAELGWLGLALPEAYGGSGSSPVETAILMEAFGRGLVLEPYLASVVLGGGLVRLGGSAAHQEALLPALAEGKLMLAFAFAEPHSRYNLAEVSVRARAADGGFVIDGHKSVVFDAACADKIVVSARTAGEVRDADGISLFVVDGDAEGLSRRDYRTVDGLRASELAFAGVAVGADALLGEKDAALPLIELAIDHATAAVCAEAVGIMAALHEATVEYLRTRTQFGTTIGSFQVLQHRAVEMFMAYEQTRSMAYMAALKLDEPAAARKKAISAAKAFVGKAGRFLGQQAIQLHGGMGVTDELAVGHYFKRLTMIDSLFGNVDHHLRRYGAL